MKSLLAAVVVGAVVASAPFAHAQTGRATGNAAMVPLAVVEFTPGANASTMTVEAKRQLQASIAFLLHDSRKFDVHDVRRTREASKSTLAAINTDASTDAAVKVGKQLGVSYVLAGMVTEYTPKGDGGFGYATLKTRLVEVATGKVVHSAETVQKGTSEMRTTGATEMQTKVLKPAIEKLTAEILGKF